MGLSWLIVVRCLYAGMLLKDRLLEGWLLEGYSLLEGQLLAIE